MAAHQALPSLEFSRQEHSSGLPFPSPMHESEKWKWSRSVVSDSSQPHGLQPTRLLCLWDFPGKSTRVGCHCLLLLPLSHQNSLYYTIDLCWLSVLYICVPTELCQSCPTLCNPMNRSLPGSFIPGILQARTLEWVAVPSSSGFPDPGIEPTFLTYPACLPLSSSGKLYIVECIC